MPLIRLALLALTIAGLFGSFIWTMDSMQSDMRNGSRDQQAEERLVVADGPVVARKEGDDVHLMAAMPVKGQKDTYSGIEITVPSAKLEAVGGTTVGAVLGKIRVLEVTGPDGSPVTTDNLGGRNKVAASKVVVHGEVAYLGE